MPLSGRGRGSTGKRSGGLRSYFHIFILTHPSRGAGEILLTSMDRDGTKSGYDLDLLKAVSESVTVPVVASGGASSPDHMADALRLRGCKVTITNLPIFTIYEYLNFLSCY